MEGTSDKEILKLVHGEGPSSITMDSNGQIVSCGRDSCSVVFHKGHLEEDSYQFEVDGTTNILDLACFKRDGDKGEEYLVAVVTDDHSVLSYSYCSGNFNDDPFAESQFDTILMRFTAQVNTLDVNKDGTKLAAGASDFLIKIVNLIDTSKITTMEGHNAPVLCVRFDPLNNYLASSSCDGTVKVWSIDTKVVVSSIDVFPKVNDVMLASTLCRFSWQPNQGKVLAVPCGDGVKIIERDSWKCINTVNEQDDKKFDHVTCWSPCERYLVIGGSHGCISVWKWPEATLVSRRNTDVGVISSLFWSYNNSSSHPLLFSSSTGRIGAFPHQWVCSSNKAPPTFDEATPIVEKEDWDDSLLLEGIPPDSIFNDEEGEDFVATATIPPSNTNSVTTSTRGKREGGDEDDELVQPPSKRKHFVPETFCDYEDDRPLLSPEISSTSEFKGTSPPPPPRPVIIEQQFHEMFQPSATPSHLSHRFMVYNMVGVVRCHDDGASPMVEVEFHDSSVHHPFSIPNHWGWSMGALSAKALILAVESNGEELSQLQCTVFSSWDQSKDWNIHLPKGESIEIITLGDTWVAIATDKNYTRVFSLGGTQHEVISIPGQIVTMAGGKGDHLLIVYQETPSSLLTVWMLDIGNKSQLHPPHLLPLTPKSKLEWIGFSEENLPLSYDTKGVVRMFSEQYGLSWLPIVDCDSLLNQKGDHYFVIGMTHNPNEMRVILCKGLDYPPVHPRPVMSTLPISLPLCDPQTEKTNLECQYLEQQFVHSPGNFPSPSESLRPLLQIMALACHSNHEFRAFEIVNMMTLEQGLELALQYASQSGHFRLARQISNLKERRAIAAEEEEEEEEVEITRQPVRTYTTRRETSHNGEEKERSNSSSQKTYRNNGVRRTLLPSNSNTQKINKENCQEVEEEEEEQNEEVNEEETDPSPLPPSLSGTPNEREYVSQDLLSNNNNNSDSSNGQFSSPQVNKQRTGNPFKMATPVAKKIHVDRRSSFLDKICQEVSEEKEKEKQKKEKIKLKPANISSTKSKGSGKKEPKSSSQNTKLSAFSFTKKS